MKSIKSKYLSTNYRTHESITRYNNKAHIELVSSQNELYI